MSGRSGEVETAYGFRNVASEMQEAKPLPVSGKIDEQVTRRHPRGEGKQVQGVETKPTEGEAKDGICGRHPGRDACNEWQLVVPCGRVDIDVR